MLVNDLKALGEKMEDKDFFYEFLRCLPSRFGTLITILVEWFGHHDTKPSVGRYNDR